MIVHQAVCPDCNFCSFSFLSHKLDIVTFIISTKKNILITISSLSYMMRNAWNYHSCQSGHFQSNEFINSYFIGRLEDKYFLKYIVECNGN